MPRRSSSSSIVSRNSSSSSHKLASSPAHSPLYKTTTYSCSAMSSSSICFVTVSITGSSFLSRTHFNTSSLLFRFPRNILGTRFVKWMREGRGMPSSSAYSGSSIWMIVSSSSSIVNMSFSRSLITEWASGSSSLIKIRLTCSCLRISFSATALLTILISLVANSMAIQFRTSASFTSAPSNISGIPFSKYTKRGR